MWCFCMRFLWKSVAMVDVLYYKKNLADISHICMYHVYNTLYDTSYYILNELESIICNNIQVTVTHKLVCAVFICLSLCCFPVMIFTLIPTFLPWFWSNLIFISWIHMYKTMKIRKSREKNTVVSIITERNLHTQGLQTNFIESILIHIPSKILSKI